MNNIFTKDELTMLSSALILAIQCNSDAARLTTSRKAVEEIEKSIYALRDLNSKICSMTPD